MKRLIFSVILLSFSVSLAGQENEYSQDFSYQERAKGYRSVWNKLIPSYTKIQYAGSMGFLSFGLGWDYGKRNQWETDFFLGFLPKFSTGKVKVTMALRQNYIPWNVKIGKSNFSFEPLSGGVYLTMIFGKQYWLMHADQYPDGYYRFSTKLRFNAFLGERFTYTLPADKKFFIKSFTFYYEVSSNEIYIEEAVKNKHLKLSDYLKLSVGIKMQIF